MDAVWDALKADANDLRKQQRILRAFRAALIPRPAEPAQAAQNARIRRRFENWQDALNDSDCSVRDCLMRRALFHAEIEDAYKAGKVIVPIAAAQEGRE